jgi:hypothetical protein
MPNIFSKIFSGDKTIDSFNNVFNKASSGIDKMIFTREELADIWVKFLKAYEPFKLAQRLLMLIVVPSFVLIILTAVVLTIISYWHPDMNEIAKSLINIASDTLGTITLIIVSFYFAGGAAEGIISKVREKK